MLLTVKKIESIKANGKRQEISHGKTGLSIRVSPSGKKTFQYRFRKNGKQTRHDYGDFPNLTLAKALTLHATVQAKIAEGVYPNKNSEASGGVITVADLCNAWFEKYCVKNRKDPSHAKQLIDGDIIPNVGNIKLAKLTKAHFRDLIDDIINRGSMTQADKCRSLSKQILSWGVERDYLESNPIQNYSARTIGFSYKPKERFLSHEEIGIFWNGLDLSAMSSPVINTLKLMLLTGTRRSEPVLAEWKHIDLEAKIWKIPKENTKSDRENIVMLSDLAIEVLANQKEFCELMGGSKWVFPSLKDPSASMMPRSITNSVRRHCEREHWKNSKGEAIEKFTPHALRHTLETNLTEMNAPYVIIKRILNHQLDNMSSTYNHAQMLEAKLEVMQTWADHIKKSIIQQKELL